ncbi:hemerythrin domain-containing protein [Vibrio sp. T187]|uniref:hemerythrin domain-containing protein n=1 Tax=Vibrio TaxID=662 RepID=UPI0010C9EFDF|nr:MULTISPECIES: hemerythrin domain-containing protein [Vibrio]MBW3697090.1 hemerythrin domain-containing protein [Vibrio sp. T187]
MMIERIRREHGYMVRLLAILKQKLAQLNSEQSINYSLVKEVVSYLTNHSETVHHPKEDIIYHHYLKKYGDLKSIDNLELEHQTLAEHTAQFLAVVEMILQDAVVPQEVFIEKLERFIQLQKQHLELEERFVLPLIIESFTIEDWQEVESQWMQPEDDPVFGETIADQYKQLAQRVRENERECV